MTQPHPHGRIRLGFTESGEYIDLLPEETETHIYVPGASGSGKSTTLIRIADGALHLRWPVVVIDCKAGDLKAKSEALAAKHGVPFRLFDPRDKRSLGYNPCVGTPSSIGDKLTGAFSYTPVAEIYKLAAQAAVPPVVRALRTRDGEDGVTLASMRTVFENADTIAELGIEVGSPHKEEMVFLANQAKMGPARDAYIGFGLRLSALLEGMFGHLYTSPYTLDWHEALREPGVTYLALPATAGAGDVELMARVIAQDLKQVCADRFEAEYRGRALRPALVIFDEAAALRESETIIDLLLQARAANLRVVVSLQYLPQSIPIRESCFGAGLLICHRVTAAAADELAAQFGTRRAREMSYSLDRTKAVTQSATLRPVEEHVIHPNQLRDMQPGFAAVRSVRGARKTVAQIYQAPP